MRLTLWLMAAWTLIAMACLVLAATDTVTAKEAVSLFTTFGTPLTGLLGFSLAYSLARSTRD